MTRTEEARRLWQVQQDLRHSDPDVRFSAMKMLIDLVWDAKQSAVHHKALQLLADRMCSDLVQTGSRDEIFAVPWSSETAARVGRAAAQ